MEVAVSRWRFASKRTSIPVLLRSLGVEFRKVKGQDFWHANRFVLPEIYREFLSEARTRYRELHPDTGGNAEEFDAFVQSVNAAKQSFAWNLGATVRRLEQTASPLTVISKRGQGGRGFYRHSKVGLVVNMIRSGKADREIERELKINRNTIRAIKKIVTGVINGCECGKSRGHKGWCHVMMKRSPKRRELMAMLHQRQRKQAA